MLPHQEKFQIAAKQFEVNVLLIFLLFSLISQLLRKCCVGSMLLIANIIFATILHNIHMVYRLYYRVIFTLTPMPNEFAPVWLLILQVNGS